MFHQLLRHCLHQLFSQWHCGNEHRGRTAALKAVAYETGEELRDERNNRKFAYPHHAHSAGVIFSNVRLPGASPFAFHHVNFLDAQGRYDARAHMQFLVTSAARFEERQRRLHPGRNQTGHNDDRPIIGRNDVIDLDKALVFDEQGNRRDGWRQNLVYVAEDIIREKFTRRGIPAVFSIHDEQGGNGNFHIHVTSFYRKLGPGGWEQQKQRPYGRAAWRGYWADGARIAQRVQRQHLKRLGIDVEPPQRLAMARTHPPPIALVAVPKATKREATHSPKIALHAAAAAAAEIVGHKQQPVEMATPAASKPAGRGEAHATASADLPAFNPPAGDAAPNVDWIRLSYAARIYAARRDKNSGEAKRLEQEMEDEINRVWEEHRLAVAFRMEANRKQRSPPRLAL